MHCDILSHLLIKTELEFGYMKPITITKNTKETLSDAAKRASNQATLNNRIVIFQDGNYSCLVYPYDIINNIIKALKRIALMVEINRLEKELIS
jgi:hypothetical protein